MSGPFVSYRPRSESAPGPLERDEGQEDHGSLLACARALEHYADREGAAGNEAEETNLLARANNFRLRVLTDRTDDKAGG